MVFAVAARTSLRQGSRGFRTSAVAKSAGHDYHHLPFQWPGEKKFAFGAKLGIFLFAGAALPVAAAIFQLKKSAGAA